MSKIRLVDNKFQSSSEADTGYLEEGFYVVAPGAMPGERDTFAGPFTTRNEAFKALFDLDGPTEGFDEFVIEVMKPIAL